MAGNNTAIDAAAAVAVADTVQEIKQVQVDVPDNEDKGEDIMALPSLGDGQDGNDDGKDTKQTQSTDNGGKNSKQKKASRWKQMNKKKKVQKREKIEDNNEKQNKRTKLWNEKGPEAPHNGSFAHEKMQTLYNVTIDVPSGGDKDEGEKVQEDAPTNGNAATDVTRVDVPSSEGEKDEAAAAAGTKIPKRKLALLVSFLGSEYAGFQINAERRTLQAELELGLHRAGVISKMNFGYPRKYGWSNAARTDKGVHAAAQCCSFKGEMIFHHEMEGAPMQEQMDAMRERVNSYLPSDVRILDFGRVTRMFCARTNRDKVRYQYMVPSYMLCSREEVCKAFPAVVETKELTSGTNTTISHTSEDLLDAEALAQARSALINYRVTPEQMERLKSGLKLFEGTHSFHNYTRRKGADNASASRYILSFAPLDPITVPGDLATQWIPLQIVGQSFLLNQIRKMVSAAVDFARGAVSEEQIRESFTKRCRMKINVAPAQGLFLDRSFFELYNKHKVESAPKHGDSRDRETLDWVEVKGEEMPAPVRRVEEFKNEKIIPHIIREEASEGNFLKYIHTHDVLYHDGMYGPIEGVVKPNIDQHVDIGAASNVDAHVK